MSNYPLFLFLISLIVIFTISDVYASGGSSALNGVDNSTAPNLGTFGSTATGKYFEPDTNSTSRDFIVNASGIINEAIFQDGESTLGSRAEVRFGESADRSQWDFLHKVNTGFDKTSINIWINGDVIGGAEYPILDTIIDTDNVPADNDGMYFFTQPGAGTIVFLVNNGQSVVTGSHSSIIANDGQWHMISVIMDKGNTTSSWGTICLDATDCQSFAGNAGNLATSGVGTANVTLTLGSRHNSDGMSLVENAYNVDDLTIWQDYILTSSDMST